MFSKKLNILCRMLKLVRMSKLFATLFIMSFLYNYFDSSTKLFSDLYLIKFLNTLAKPFFLVNIILFVFCRKLY